MATKRKYQGMGAHPSLVSTFKKESIPMEKSSIDRWLSRNARALERLVLIFVAAFILIVPMVILTDFSGLIEMQFMSWFRLVIDGRPL